jgi:hypothetical protein
MRPGTEDNLNLQQSTTGITAIVVTMCHLLLARHHTRHFSGSYSGNNMKVYFLYIEETNHSEEQEGLRKMISE